MKIITSPACSEQSIYYSDFSGVCFPHLPHATLKLEFNYGSVDDGARLEFHLSDLDAQGVVEFLKSKLSRDCIDSLKRQIHNIDDCYEEALDSRNWSTSDLLLNSKELIKKLID